MGMADALRKRKQAHLLSLAKNHARLTQLATKNMSAALKMAAKKRSSVVSGALVAATRARAAAKAAQRIAGRARVAGTRAPAIQIHPTIPSKVAEWPSQSSDGEADSVAGARGQSSGNPNEAWAVDG